MSSNHYDTLGVKENASETDIKKAYRSLSLKYHPDRNLDQDSTTKFQEINAAYEVLGDSQKRKQYDMGFGDNDMPGGFPFQGGPGGFPFPGGPNGFPFPGGVHFTHMGGGGGPPQGMENLFEAFFNGMGGGGGPGGPGPKIRIFQSKPRNIEKIVEVTLEQIYNGDPFSIVLERVNNETNVKENQHVQIPIPKGIANGESILLTGVGNRGPNNTMGDVKLTIRVLPHDVFERKGIDLYCKKQITLKEALCGFTIEINHLNGKTLRLNNITNKSVITPGYVREFVDYGMTKGDTTGKLFVQFEILFPETLTTEQMVELEKILGESD